jgi:hypothetical protein
LGLRGQYDFGNARKYLFHSFQVEPLSSDLPGVLVFPQDRYEPVGFTLGAGDPGLAKGFGGLTQMERLGRF